MPNRSAARKKIQRHKAVPISLDPAAGSSLVPLIRDGSPWPTRACAAVPAALVALGVDVAAGVLVLVGDRAGVLVDVAGAVDVAAGSAAVDVAEAVAAAAIRDAASAVIGTLVAVAVEVDVAAGSSAGVDVGVAVAAGAVGTLVAVHVGTVDPTSSCAGSTAGVITDPSLWMKSWASQLNFASPSVRPTNCTVAAVPLPDAMPPGLSAYA